MEDDKRDELLIRLDERTSVMAGDIKDLKATAADTGHRLDRLEAGGQKPPTAPPTVPAEDKSGRWAAFFEMIAAAPAVVHVGLAAALSIVGLLSAALTWMYNHAPK